MVFGFEAVFLGDPHAIAIESKVTAAMHFRAKSKFTKGRKSQSKFVAVSKIQIFSLKFVDNLENVVKNVRIRQKPKQTKLYLKTL